MATEYTNPGGSGNRVGTITVTHSANLFDNSATAIAGLINGNTTENTWFFQSGKTDGEIIFQFDRTKIIDSFKWYQSNNTAHGNWRWYSSNDGSVYTARGNTVSLAGPAGGGNTEFTEPNGNTVAALYWKLKQESGSTSAGPFLREIEFKILDGEANAAIAETIGAFTQSLTAGTVNNSALTQTIDAFVQTLTAATPVSAAIAQTIPVFTQTLTVGSTIRASLSQTINAFSNITYGVPHIIHLPAGSQGWERRPGVMTVGKGGPRKFR